MSETDKVVHQHPGNAAADAVADFTLAQRLVNKKQTIFQVCMFACCVSFQPFFSSRFSFFVIICYFFGGVFVM